MIRKLICCLTGLCLSLACIASVQAQQRIVSTDAAATQILFALGAEAALVGVDVTSTLPPGYREVAGVGYHRALSAEGLLSLNPSLVIGSEQIGPPGVLDTLDAAGVSVLQLPAANTIAALKANIAAIAAATNTGDRIPTIHEQLDTMARDLAAGAASMQRMAFVLSVEPGKLRIAGLDTTGNAFIELLGGQNIAGFAAYRTLSAEAVLELAPAVILVANHEGGSPARVLELNPILRYSKAARSNRIVSVDAANLAAGLSPDAIADASALLASINLEPQPN